jgi:hypothetical protein
MRADPPLEEAICQAVAKIHDFVKQVSGVEPSQAEIADALTRYFVLKEINDHIVMARSKGH